MQTLIPPREENQLPEIFNTAVAYLFVSKASLNELNKQEFVTFESLTPIYVTLFFASEHFFKNLLFPRKNVSVKAYGHRLHDLFSEIDVNIKSRIATTLDLSTELIQSKLHQETINFLKWRYPWESPGAGMWAMDLEFMFKLNELLFVISNEWLINPPLLIANKSVGSKTIESFYGLKNKLLINKGYTQTWCRATKEERKMIPNAGTDLYVMKPALINFNIKSRGYYFLRFLKNILVRKTILVSESIPKRVFVSEDITV